MTIDPGSGASPCWAAVMIAALFVETDGCYFNLPGVDPWDIERDARKYTGPHPVVAHPPCQLWGRLAPVNYARYGGDHNKPGNDGGCFESALRSVYEYGGVIEHPAQSKAFSMYGIDPPDGRGWTPSGFKPPHGEHGWICEVWQSAYGHRANKATWLFYFSPYDNPPRELDWSRPRGTHQVGWHGVTPKCRSRPTLAKRESNATPPAFRDVLLDLARLAVSERP